MIASMPQPETVHYWAKTETGSYIIGEPVCWTGVVVIAEGEEVGSPEEGGADKSPPPKRFAPPEVTAIRRVGSGTVRRPRFTTGPVTPRARTAPLAGVSGHPIA